MTFLTNSGVPGLGVIPWGAHLCQLYRGADDLAHGVVPFFVTGLRNNQKGLWHTAASFPAEAARAALAARLPELPDYLASGQMVIADHGTSYGADRAADEHCDVIERWLADEREALKAGFAGYRIASVVTWVDREKRTAVMHAEARVQRRLEESRIVAMCCYSLDGCTEGDVVEIMSHHQIVVSRRRNEDWKVMAALEAP